MKKIVSLFCLLSFSIASPTIAFNTINEAIENNCADCVEKSQTSTATVILDKGETALLSRAWLTSHALKNIDIQYFIWSEDNIGILAATSLLDAANKNVKIRVIIDDFLIDTDSKSLLALAAHPNIDIKVYNPVHKVGVSTFQRIKNLLTGFRNSNQRMHDKLVIFDQQIAITGGRNMADEYFDFDREYAFRDRDVLVYGQSVATMQHSFNTFWNHPLSQSINSLLEEELASLSQEDIEATYSYLMSYANDPQNFAPEVRDSIYQLENNFELVAEEATWSDARFIHDQPGKNDASSGLKGGSESTSALVELLENAEQEIFIQSPYLVIPDEALNLFKRLIDREVDIKISTNSLASTDNLAAYSGYHKKRDLFLKAGIQLFEYKPNPNNQAILHQRYLKHKSNSPIFAIHAKSMVIDGKIALIGSFNLDPRSIHLNTEVAMVIPDIAKAHELKSLIIDDIKPENSWHIQLDDNTDQGVSFWKKIKLTAYKLLPLEPIL